MGGREERAYGTLCIGQGKLQRPMMWTIWHRVAENKMKLKGISDNGQRIKYLRRYAGAELTNIWEKEERRVFEANREGEGGDGPHI